MNSYRARLALIMIVLIGLSVTASGIYMVKSFERSHYDALQDNLMREIGLIADDIDWKEAEGEIGRASCRERV